MTQPPRRWSVLIGATALVAMLSACSGAVVVQGRPEPAPPGPGRSAPTGAQITLRLPPASVLDSIGAGTSTAPTAGRGSALRTPAGLPRVLYAGAEYCPYCASENWAVALALLRFGTLGPLEEVRSSRTDVDPHTATVTFHDASFTSATIGFTGVELYGTRRTSSGGYAPLDRLTPADQKVFDRLDTGRAIPFVDIGGRYLINGTSFDTGVLRGLTQARIVSDLGDARSPVARGIDGAADVITAAVCSVTSGAPASVCRSRGVLAARARLPAR